MPAALIHPADPKKISDTFGTHSALRKSLGLGPHRGLDYALKSGTPLKSVGTGRILGYYWSDILGHVLEIRVGTPLGVRVFAYCHLLEEPKVKAGDVVRQGDVICKSGNSGSASSGPHLHLMAGKKGRLAISTVEDPKKVIEAPATA